jgi:hypothetical protein
MLLLFDPVSLAVAASVIENACQPHPRRLVPLARLRRHVKPIANSALRESIDPLLDAINQIDPHLGAVLMFIATVGCMAHIRYEARPFWLCVAAHAHAVVALMCYDLY